MITKVLITILLLHTLSSQFNSPFIGGNQFNSYYTNPNLINSFLGQINQTIAPACNRIPGIGQPVLVIKQVLQTVDLALSSNNSQTSAKMIFFKEKRNTNNFQTTYKMVIQIKSFSSNNYLAVEGLYRQMGFPAFEITTYYLDSNLENVKSLLEEYSIDPRMFVGCGNIKSLYSQANPGKTATSNLPAPFNQGSRIVNSPPPAAGNSSTIDPAVIAQIIKLLQSRN